MFLSLERNQVRVAFAISITKSDHVLLDDIMAAVISVISETIVML